MPSFTEIQYFVFAISQRLDGAVNVLTSSSVKVSGFVSVPTKIARLIRTVIFTDLDRGRPSSANTYVDPNLGDYVTSSVGAPVVNS